MFVLRNLRLKFMVLVVVVGFVYVYTTLQDSVKVKSKTNIESFLKEEIFEFDGGVKESDGVNNNDGGESSSDQMSDFRLNQEIKRDKVYLDSVLSKSDSITTKLNRKFKVIKSGRNVNQPDEKKKHLIVEYTNVFFKPKFCDKTSAEVFNSELEQCEYQNCEYTCDKSASTLSKASALLFHLRDLEAELEFGHQFNWEKWLDATKQLPFKTTSAKLASNPNAVWILWNDEATRVNEKFNKLSKLFNWTLSFRTASEVNKGSYGFFKPKYDQLISVDQLKSLKIQIQRDHFKKRLSAILWFVSNCQAKARLKLVLEISKHYPVHVYTKCDVSNFQDAQGSFKHLTVFSEPCDHKSKCETDSFAKYKYYMAFENTNCTDYITEKVWKSLSNHMIPIVMQPGKDSFSRSTIPSRSFIHLQDFDQNPSRLATYLRRVDADFELYYGYLKWTFVYLRVVSDARLTEPHRMCHMCQMLNTYDRHVHYTGLADFFNNDCSA